jgi:hypothetical protein
MPLDWQSFLKFFSSTTLPTHPSTRTKPASSPKRRVKKKKSHQEESGLYGKKRRRIDHSSSRSSFMEH